MIFLIYFFEREKELSLRWNLNFKHIVFQRNFLILSLYTIYNTFLTAKKVDLCIRKFQIWLKNACLFWKMLDFFEKCLTNDKFLFYRWYADSNCKSKLASVLRKILSSNKADMATSCFEFSQCISWKHSSE